ncbi:MAG: GMP synthase (glutamine-hydrolyzing), partial [Candidatus Omnitrophica bacterium CG11_big_fil_rev_8_21_14_0_20_64_10]
MAAGAATHEKILILDFGSQYAQLIARRVRELGVFSRIVPHDISPEQIAQENPKGVILSGGPASVLADGAPMPHPKLFTLPVPTLGICYGMQLMGRMLGGQVAKADSREYGKAELIVDQADGLFDGLPGKFTSWMSHGDHVSRLPAGFSTIAHTDNAP